MADMGVFSGSLADQSLLLLLLTHLQAHPHFCFALRLL